MDTAKHPRQHWWVVGLVIILMLGAAGSWWYLNSPYYEERTDPSAASVQSATTEKQKKPDRSVELQTAVDAFVAANPTDYGIYIEDLESGSSASHQADVKFTSASMYKPYVAFESFKQVDAGNWELTDTVSGRSLLDCIEIMINISDNECGKALQIKTGALRGTVDWAAYGFPNTTLTGLYPKTTANDLATLFKDLQAGKSLSKTSNDYFMQFLKDQQVNDRLPVNLPAGTQIAHKTGDLEGYAHDGGIVYGPNGPYIIVILSGPWQSPGTFYDEAAVFSRQIYDILSQAS